MAKHKVKYSKRHEERQIPFFWISVGFILLLVAAVGVWQVWGTTETGPGKIGPRLAVDQERIDLGRQPFDKMVSAEFRVTNTGDRTLTLDASSPIRVVEGC